MVGAGASFVREDIWFVSSGVRCAGSLYRSEPASEPRVPCIVMGHGFGGVREALAPHAERFARAGYAVLTFDYRSFGRSEGEPRQILDIAGQHTDWSAAVAHARTLSGIDPERIVLWGTSFAGGHVMELASRDPKLAAAIAQVPHTSGLAAARSGRPSTQLRLAREAMLDLLGARRGQAPRYVPLIGARDELAAMTTPGALDWLRRMQAMAPTQRNEVAARVFLEVPRYSPGRRARYVRCPLLVLVADRDTLTPAEPAVRAAQRAAFGEVRRYPIEHFDIYFGEWLEQALTDTLDFLRRHVPLAVRPQTGPVRTGTSPRA